MPKKKFAFERGGPDRLELSWSGMWKNFQVTLDGNPIGGMNGTKEVKEGRDFPLGDGTTLHVQLVQSFANTELQVMRDGVALPGSGSDPEERLKQAWMMVFFVAGLNALVGIIAVAFDSELLLNLGIGVPSIVLGVFYAVLAWLVRTYRSAIALGIAIAIFAIDGLLSVVMSTSAGGSPPIGAIIFRVFLIFPMIRGFAAIKELKLQGPAADPIARAPGAPRGERRAANDPWQGPDR